MANINKNAADAKSKNNNADSDEQNVSSPYPVETIHEAIANVEKIVNYFGSSKAISKEQISEVLGRRSNTLNLFFSTWRQYGIMTNVRGNGYQPTDLYRQYIERDDRTALHEMFKNAPLYNKIISIENGKALPAQDKFHNILKEAPYYINPNSAERAAKIFYQNIEKLGLWDRRTHIFKYPPAGEGGQLHDKQIMSINNIPENETADPKYFTIVIPTSNDTFTQVKMPVKYSGDDIHKVSAIVSAYLNNGITL